MKRQVKAFRKRFFCLVLAFVLLFAYVSDLTPKAKAVTPTDILKQVEDIAGAVGNIKETDVRLIMAQIDLIAKKVALEQKITVGALSGAALAKANVILLELQAKIAASGIKAATCAKFFAWAAVAGVVIECTDWKNVWDAVFDKETFFEEKYITMANPASSAIVNYTNIDDKITALVKAFDKNGEYWDYDYIETTNAGWGIISDWAKGIFGSNKTETPQTLPPMPISEVLNTSGLQKYTGNTTGYKAIYTIPLGAMVTDIKGNYAYSYLISNVKLGVTYSYYNINGVFVTDNRNYDIASITGSLALMFLTDTSAYIGVLYGDGGRSPHTTFTFPSTFYKDLPPYINNTAGVTGDREVAIEDLMPEEKEEKKIRYPLPEFTPDPTKTDEENLVAYIETFPPTVIPPQVEGVTKPEVTPSPEPSPTPDPDTGTSPKPDDPSNPDDPEQPTKKLDFSPLLNITGLAEVFPFSLPFDYINLIKTFNSPRKNPIFNISLPLVKGHSFNMTLDFTLLDPIMTIVRGMFQLGFAVALMFITYKFIKW